MTNNKSLWEENLKITCSPSALVVMSSFPDSFKLSFHLSKIPFELNCTQLHLKILYIIFSTVVAGI